MEKTDTGLNPLSHRTQLFNEIIAKRNFSTYLEIGVSKGRNFRSIELPSVKIANGGPRFKIGVDPNVKSRRATHHMTSDGFFDKYRNFKFDLIFIDGDHSHVQVMKDVFNSINALNKGGIIVLHDCNPKTYGNQVIPRRRKGWNGSVWKAWIRLRSQLGREMFCIDTDSGLGVILDKKAPTHDVGKVVLKYTELVENRKGWLNLVSLEEGLKLLNIS